MAHGGGEAFAGTECSRDEAEMTSKIEVVKTDITTLAVDAIVNAANTIAARRRRRGWGYSSRGGAGAI